jgi:transketolase
VDGHDVDALLQALTEPPQENRPIVLIARTTKGKGVSFMENEVLWHYRAPDADEYARARRELSRR